MQRRTFSTPEYETQIINASGKVAFIRTGKYLSDFIAIRSALKMCRDNESAEVWRDNDCIYTHGGVTSAVATETHR